MKKNAASDEAPPPEIKGSEADYQRFLPDAQQIDARDIKPLRADPSLAYHNAARGVAAVFAHEARIKQELPAIAIESLRSIPALALGHGRATERAAVVEAKLLEVLNPKGASKKRKVGSEAEQKASARDRLWSLLLERHEDLWRAGDSHSP